MFVGLGIAYALFSILFAERYMPAKAMMLGTLEMMLPLHLPSSTIYRAHPKGSCGPSKPRQLPFHSRTRPARHPQPVHEKLGNRRNLSEATGQHVPVWMETLDETDAELQAQPNLSDGRFFASARLL